MPAHFGRILRSSGAGFDSRLEESASRKEVTFMETTRMNPAKGLYLLHPSPCNSCNSTLLSCMAKKMLAAVEQSPSIVIISDVSGKIEYVNPKYEKVSGYSYQEISGKFLHQMTGDPTRQDQIDLMIASLKSGAEWQGEFRCKKKTGEHYWVSTHISPLRDEAGIITHFIDVEEDITQHKLADDRLIASLKEKEMLLKEVHHRVKNNLQIICSLLNLQSGYITDRHDLAVFQECQDRVRSMALIHQLMYQSRDLSHIDLEYYIRNLMDYLLVSYAARHKITASIRGETKVYLDANMAVPCGLILNELITNSIKYAFQGREKGKITIVIEKSGENVTLSVGDDGIGLPYEYDLTSAKTLGLQLVYDLTEQINGSIQVDRSEGTRFRITFFESSQVNNR